MQTFSKVSVTIPLEEKEKVVKLLGAYLDTRQEAVRVVIGLDEALPASNLQNFVLIGAPARVGHRVARVHRESVSRLASTETGPPL